MSKTLYILRGLPGSGKSTRAKELTKDGGVIISSDYYFIRPDGTYDWHGRYIERAHAWCRQQFDIAIEKNPSVIVIDNINLQPWCFMYYKNEALSRGYEVKEEIIGEFTDEAVALYASRNVHNVTTPIIKSMANSWEP